MSLILKQEDSANVPTPDGGKGTLFLNPSDQLAVKDSNGNVSTIQMVSNTGNTQVLFNDNGALGGDANFTFNKTNDTLSIANITSNGTVNFTNATNVSLGAVGNLSITGGSNGQVLTTNGSGGLSWATSSGGAANTANTVTNNAQPNITSVGTLTGLSVTGTSNLGPVGNVTITGGSNGQVLTTNGSGVLSWATASAGANVAGSNTQVQFNDNGNLGASALFSFVANVSNSSAVLNLGNSTTSGFFTVPYSTTVSPATVYLLGANCEGSGNAGGLAVVAGGSSLTGPGGSAYVYAGSSQYGSGGQIYALGAQSGGSGGDINIDGGYGSLTRPGGNITLTTGGSAANTPGSITFRTAGGTERFRITSVGAWSVGNAGSNTGTSGQVLTSQGSSSPPIWTDVSAGTAGTVTTAAQPNITSVGTLTSLTVSGNLTAQSNIILGVSPNSGQILAATRATSGSGLSINLTASNANTNGGGGTVTLQGGSSAGNNPGGSINLVAGIGVQPGIGAGEISLTSPNGNIYMYTGGTVRFSIGPAGQLSTSGGFTNYGNSGQVLTSQGSGSPPIWSNVSASTANNIAGGSAGQIPIQSGANTTTFTSDLTFSNVGGYNTLAIGNATTTPLIRAANNTTSGIGLLIYGGNTTTSGTGGSVTVSGGRSANGPGGTVYISGAAGTGPNRDGGTVSIVSGYNTGTGTAGNISILAASNGTGTAGFIQMYTGGNAASPTERFRILGNGAWSVGNAGTNTGTSGQVLTSQGSDSPPIWSNVTAATAGTVTTNAQPNITSVGTLTSLAVTGNITGGNVYANTGTIGASLLTGTLTTAAQPNITSIGTLSSLTTTGNVTASNVTGGNLVTANFIAGTLTTASQPNITGVGTLSSLTVTGNIQTSANLVTDLIVGRTTGISIASAGTNQPVFLKPTGTGSVDVWGAKVSNVATPTASTDAATKQYVDNVAQGLHTHAPCSAATPDTLANISSGTITYNNGTSGVGATLTTTGSYATIDGVNIDTIGTRILVKNEANAAHNGIYTYTSGTVLTRATDFDTSTEMAGGDFTFVQQGTLYNDTGWVMTDPVTTVGTTSVNFVQFSGAGTYTAGTGLTLTGTQFSISNTAVTAATYGNGDRVATFTVNAQGQLTNASNVVIAANAANLTGTTLASSIVNSSLTSVGTLTSLAVTGNVTAGNLVGTLANGNSNISIPAANGNITFATAGSERMRVVSTGEVVISNNRFTPTVAFSTSGGRLQLIGDNAAAHIQLQRNQTTINGASVLAYKSNGTSDSPTVVVNGDAVTQWIARGYDGANYDDLAMITMAVDGTPGTDDMPGRIVFSTTPDGGNAVSERMRIDSSGNVGIGTTSPGNFGKFAVQGASTTRVFYADSLAQPVARYDDNSFVSNGLTIRNSGVSGSNQGIGLLFQLGTGGTPVDAGAIQMRSEQDFSSAANQDAAMTFSTVLNGTTAERMRLDSSGNLGIGTTNTGTAGLSLSQSFNLSWEQSATESIATLFRQTSSAALVLASGYKRSATSNGFASSYASSWAKTAISLGTSSGAISFYTDTATTVAVGTDVTPTERMRIDSTGNVGVGTTSPVNKFVVSNSGAQGFEFDPSTGIYQVYNRSTSAYGQMLVYSSVMRIFTGTSPVERMRVTSDGEVYIAGTTDQGAYNLQVNGTGVWGAGAYVNGSDARIKEDVEPIESGLDVVEKLNPVTYRYKESWSTDQNIQPGFIAQELLTALEETNYANGVVFQGGTEGYYSVAYQNLIPVLTKAIQELSAKNEILEARLAALENKVNNG